MPAYRACSQFNGADNLLSRAWALEIQLHDCTDFDCSVVFYHLRFEAPAPPAEIQQKLQAWRVEHGGGAGVLLDGVGRRQGPAAPVARSVARLQRDRLLFFQLRMC